MDIIIFTGFVLVLSAFYYILIIFKSLFAKFKLYGAFN
jgi:hypothetical protein